VWLFGARRARGRNSPETDPLESGARSSYSEMGGETDGQDAVRSRSAAR